MNISRYLYCAVVCVIPTLTFTIVNANNEDIISGSFKTKSSTIIFQSENTTDVYSRSLISCADMCLSDPQCCVASYSKGTSTCRIDTSSGCGVETKPLNGWRFIEQKSYLPPSCSECINYGSSTYKVIEDAVNWEMARDDCYNLGGKLVEMETQDENDFIKATLTVRNENITEYKVYFIGGYKFNANENIRWISTPSQDMTFLDFGQLEPTDPTSELCLGNFNVYNFQWIDLPCDWLQPYICEFVY